MIPLLISIPTVLTADRISNYKSLIYPIKNAVKLGLCRAVKPPPLFRGEARVIVRGKAIDVLLRRLWGWRGSVQREEQARQGRLSVCAQSFARMQNHTSTHRRSPDEKGV